MISVDTGFLYALLDKSDAHAAFDAIFSTLVRFLLGFLA